MGGARHAQMARLVRRRPADPRLAHVQSFGLAGAGEVLGS
jgi:hypothetical protein